MEKKTSVKDGKVSRNNMPGFTVAIELIRRKDLSVYEKVLFAWLDFRQGNNRSAWWSVNGMAVELCFANITIQRSLKRLEAKGMIEIRRSKGGSSRATQNITIITGMPKKKTGLRGISEIPVRGISESSEGYLKDTRKVKLKRKRRESKRGTKKKGSPALFESKKISDEERELVEQLTEILLKECRQSRGWVKKDPGPRGKTIRTKLLGASRAYGAGVLRKAIENVGSKARIGDGLGLVKRECIRLEGKVAVDRAVADHDEYRTAPPMENVGNKIQVETLLKNIRWDGEGTGVDTGAERLRQKQKLAECGKAKLTGGKAKEIPKKIS